MKIIGVSNLNQDTVSDILVESDVSAFDIAAKVKDLNAKSDPMGTYYYIPAEDDHVLYEWKP